ncbi:helix-turn-helix domain-containing protein [Peribacillus simplex]|uniref:helix-turn-helix domain-containing protein n=1 Tax=Peribacillus simplex TaxID=1478 RepID=UPI0036DB2C55
MNKGYIRTGHLVYMIIIAIIVLSFFLVIAFGGTDNASTKIGTASTVSSLILSVIAIVMSLVDVAGQRQSIVDLKETSDQLTKSNDKSHVLIENLMIKIEEISLLKDSLLEQINTNEVWKNEIKEIIGNTEEKKPEDYKKIIDELVKKSEDELFTKVRADKKQKFAYYDISTENQLRANSVLDYLMRTMPVAGDSLILVTESVAEEFNITRATASKILRTLEERGYIEIGKTTIRIK